MGPGRAGIELANPGVQSNTHLVRRVIDCATPPVSLSCVPENSWSPPTRCGIAGGGGGGGGGKIAFYGAF